ncbi:MAG: heparinase II/III domain-containing protein [Chloroflexota bacterium]
MTSRVSAALKYLSQYGLRPLALLALYKFGLATGHYKRIENREIENSYSFSSLLPFPSREQLTKTLGEDGQAALLKEADEIVAGKFRRFGDELAEIDLTLPQQLHHWTAYETGKIDLRPLTFDLKYLWEPARFGWTFALGRAYHLTQDAKYAESFWNYFETFSTSNPAYLGPHWMNGQEVAVRLMALIWAAQVFDTQDEKRKTQLVMSIVQHAARIPPTLVYARSQNNNHLVTEAAALFVAGRTLKNRAWRDLGWKWLNWAFQNQISGYGEYIQHSTNYHRVMLQAALLAEAVRDEAWPRATEQALGRAAHWLFSMLDPVSGRTPNLGSNDGALILPLSATPFNDFRPTVQAAARAFLKTQIPAGVWDEMSLWLGLAPVQKTYTPEHYMTDNLRGPNSWAYLRASRFPSRLAHMDQLHLDLWWRGLNIAQDAGTHLYNAPAPWDNPLVTTRVHNTLTVDGRDQMTRAGRFMVLDWASAVSTSEITLDAQELLRVKATFKGYRDVLHERIVMALADDTWRVEDHLSNLRRGSVHTCRIHWLLPDWEWRLEQKAGGVVLTLQSPHGPLRLDCFFDSSSVYFKTNVTLVRAGEVIHGEGQALAFEGWVSPTYGQKQPALSLSAELTSDHDALFISQFTFPQPSPGEDR